MSCNLTSGRIVPCRNKSGSIKEVLFADFGSLGTITESAGLITAFSGTPAFFSYDVRGTSNLDTVVTSSRENGTTFYTQTLNLTLTYLDAKTQAELQEIAVARPYVVVEDYYGNQFLCGLENGMEFVSGTVVSGAAAGDLSGFTLVMEGQEELAPYFLDSGLITASLVQIDPN